MQGGMRGGWWENPPGPHGQGNRNSAAQQVANATALRAMSRGAAPEYRQVSDL